MIVLIVGIILSSIIFAKIEEQRKFGEVLKDKSTKRKLTIISVTALIVGFLIYEFAGLIIPSLIKDIIATIFFLPFVFKVTIEGMALEKEKEEKERKLKEEPLPYCYYCGEVLNGEIVCPKCGKDLKDKQE